MVAERVEPDAAGVPVMDGRYGRADAGTSKTSACAPALPPPAATADTLGFEEP